MAAGQWWSFICRRCRRPCDELVGTWAEPMCRRCYDETKAA